MKASRNSTRHTLHTWAKMLLAYVEILTVRILASVFRDVIGWFNVRFHEQGNKRTAHLPVFQGSTCSLMSMTLSLITTSNHPILSNHTRLFGMVPKSDTQRQLSPSYAAGVLKWLSSLTCIVSQSSMAGRRCNYAFQAERGGRRS